MKWELLFTHLIEKNIKSREAEEVAEGYPATINAIELEVLALGPLTLPRPPTTTAATTNHRK